MPNRPTMGASLMRPPTATRGRRPGVLYAHMLEGEPHPAAYQGATPADGAAQPTHSTRARAHPRAHYLLDQHGPSPTSQKENDDRRSSQRRSAQKPHIWSSSPHMADIRLHLRPTLTTSTSSPHPPPPRLAGDVPQRVARQRGPGPPPRLVGSAARGRARSLPPFGTEGPPPRRQGPAACIILILLRLMLYYMWCRVFLNFPSRCNAWAIFLV
jgi:hypothetical protein